MPRRTEIARPNWRLDEYGIDVTTREIVDRSFDGGFNMTLKRPISLPRVACLDEPPAKWQAPKSWGTSH